MQTAFPLSRYPVLADLVDQLFNSSEKRLARDEAEQAALEAGTREVRKDNLWATSDFFTVSTAHVTIIIPRGLRYAANAPQQIATIVLPLIRLHFVECARRLGDLGSRDWLTTAF